MKSFAACNQSPLSTTPAPNSPLHWQSRSTRIFTFPPRSTVTSSESNSGGQLTTPTTSNSLCIHLCLSPAVLSLPLKRRNAVHSHSLPVAQSLTVLVHLILSLRATAGQDRRLRPALSTPPPVSGTRPCRFSSRSVGAGRSCPRVVRAGPALSRSPAGNVYLVPYVLGGVCSKTGNKTHKQILVADSGTPSLRYIWFRRHLVRYQDR